ncbi:cysteine desulfurase [Candidatus Woesearchaeota archaeon]|nr:cysteine desulfurase [Candidatus Woesearchaeota archaeon]
MILDPPHQHHSPQEHDGEHKDEKHEEFGERIRQDFPILQARVKNKPLIYLDSAATSQKPRQVIEALKKYYEEYNANVHRGIYALSEKATMAYEHARFIIARFINAEQHEIIFTKGTTESLNLLAYSLSKQLKKGDNIVLTQMEHHSNLVPWQQLAKESKRDGKDIEVRFIKITGDGRLDMGHARQCIDDSTKIVSVTHMSNVLGTINPVQELASLAHEHGALLVVDAAQSVPHMKIDVKELGCDFLAFSGHKLFGPTGIGVLYGRKELLAKLPPFLYGGDMIHEVRFEDSTFADAPNKFEAGTPNMAGAIGLAKAVEYLQQIGMENITEYEQELTAYALHRLQEMEGITVYGPPDAAARGGVISFTIAGIHPHDVAQLLDRDGICVRGGHHCAMPLMGVLGIAGSVRASLSMYNTKEDIGLLIAAIHKAQKMFS